MSQTNFSKLRQENLLLSLLSLRSERNSRQLSLLNTQFRFNNFFDSSKSSIQID